MAAIAHSTIQPVGHSARGQPAGANRRQGQSREGEAAPRHTQLASPPPWPSASAAPPPSPAHRLTHAPMRPCPDLLAGSLPSCLGGGTLPPRPPTGSGPPATSGVAGWPAGASPHYFAGSSSPSGEQRFSSVLTASVQLIGDLGEIGNRLGIGDLGNSGTRKQGT